jgi:hypothetical protein
LRNTHPAFQGQVQVESPFNHALTLTWKCERHLAKLEVDFNEPQARITYSTADGVQQRAVGIPISRTSSASKDL